MTLARPLTIDHSKEVPNHTPGKDIASLTMDYLTGPGVTVDLSDGVGDYDIYTSQTVEERVKVREGDILIIHTGYHHFGWDHPTVDEIAYMVKHPGPDREFAQWCKARKLKWLAVDCGSALSGLGGGSSRKGADSISIPSTR